MTKYTPTVEEVREAYQVAGDGADFKRRFNERGIEFDRMVASVERAAAVKALREAAADFRNAARAGVEPELNLLAAKLLDRRAGRYDEPAQSLSIESGEQA